MTEVLLVSDGFFHPSRAARRAVADLFTSLPECRLTQVGHLDALVGLDLKRFQAMILYFHHKRVTLEAIVAFKQFVQQGGGVLAIHSATASFKDQTSYFEILGGRFSGHGPVESCDIHPADGESLTLDFQNAVREIESES